MRAQILYNHLYFSKLPDDYLSALLKGKAYRRIVDHRNYSPRIVEWMTEWQNLDDVAPSAYLATFLSNLDNPRKLWLHAYENQILDASRHLLLVMWTFWFEPCLDVLEEAFLAFHSQQANKHHMDTGPRDFRRALKELDGTFLRVRTDDRSGCTTVMFHNPSVRDFLQSYLDEERELIRDLVGSAILHGQIGQLWGVSPWHPNPQIREWLASDETVLVESLLRTLGSKATVFQRMAGRVVSLERDVPVRRDLTSSSGSRMMSRHRR